MKIGVFLFFGAKMEVSIHISLKTLSNHHFFKVTVKENS